MAKDKRKFDVVLYGATGFVGLQTAAYFAAHAANMRWAIAGRNATKLREVAARFGLGADVGVIVADAADAKALSDLASQANVVLSTAGPYALYGSLLMAACVQHRTHYVDITGETPWVRRMIDAHHAQAAKDGTRIIPGCGFDSVPSDIGVLLVAQALLKQYGERACRVKAAFSLRGGLNGGTFASLVNIVESGDSSALEQPFLLNSAGTVPADLQAHQDPFAPHRDADFGAWLGPFVMGPINTRVVRRSAALSQHERDSAYAGDFAYQEYLRFGNGAVAALAAAAFSVGMNAGQSAMKLSALRSLAKLLAPAPGQGPSEQAMNGGAFRCDLIGFSVSGNTVRGRIADKGDPGNRATTKFVCEAALTLAAGASGLPGGKQRGGVLTPATGLGLPYAQRLVAAGMTLEPLAG
jgi:short subunit dehydrogenase-like uncharacterized protein